MKWAAEVTQEEVSNIFPSLMTRFTESQGNKLDFRCQIVIPASTQAFLHTQFILQGRKTVSLIISIISLVV